MARADVNITPGNSLTHSNQSAYLVKTPGGSIYCVFASQVDNGLFWTYSTNGGFTWSDPVSIKSLGSASQAGWSLWYDKWTPSDSGTKIWITYFEATGDDVFSRSLDTADNSLGTEVTVFAGTSSSNAASACISITKARGGYLYVAFDIDGGAETGFYRSIDAGANWTARTDVNESTSDYYLLAPGFGADNQDIICIYWDRSADEISRKLYDDSGNSWGKSSIATSMVDFSAGTASAQFALVVDAANSKLMLAAWSNADTANADLRFWSTITEATITEATNIVLNSGDDQGLVALAYATDTTTLYAYYLGKSDGAETWGTSLNVYYKTSTDAGTTWSAETLLSTFGVRGIDYLVTFPVFAGDFGAAWGSQTAGIDTLIYSALFPTAGGGGRDG